MRTRHRPLNRNLSQRPLNEHPTRHFNICILEFGFRICFEFRISDFEFPLMSSMRDIRHRIRSVGNTAKITKAMQMVAASKMRKAQQAALNMRPFARLLYRIQRTATTQAVDFTHPLIEKREVKKTAVVLVGGDKGLCGALNSNLFRTAAPFNPQSTVFITAGRKAAQWVARTRRQLAAEFAYGDTPRFVEARAIATM